MFHYTSQKGFEGIVKEDGIHLWFSDARYMNDSSELLSAKSFLDQAADELLEEKKIDASLHYDIINTEYSPVKIDGAYYISKKARKNSKGVIHEACIQLQSHYEHKYVCCFSREPDSLPMWNYYLKTDGHGYAVGIDLSDITVDTFKIAGNTTNKADFELSTEISDVTYDNREKLRILKNAILDLSDQYAEYPDDITKKQECLVAFQNKFETYSTIFKDYHFKYENELRMISTVKSSDSYIDNQHRDDIKFRLSHGLTIPYFELIIPHKQALKSVSISPMIGLNSDTDFVIESMSVYLHNLGYTHDIEIRCSEIPLRYY